MQMTNIGAMLNRHGWDTEVFDLSANLDRTLSYRENKANIARMTGINLGMDTGMKHMHTQAAYRSQVKKQRADPMYQTGKFSNQVWDLRYQAMPPGKRFSRKTGRRYYERRENRSDRGYRV